MKTKKIEIWIEKRERITFFNSPVKIRAVCIGCHGEAVFVAPEHAAAISNFSIREIFRLVESSAIHFIETADEVTLICAASLSAINSGDLKQFDSSPHKGEN